MRAFEFIVEDQDKGILPRVKKALPKSYIIPSLSGLDPYQQYRFGVAVAGAKGNDERSQGNKHDYSDKSDWAQHQLVIGYAEPGMDAWINDALAQIGMPGSAKLINTPGSSEEDDVATTSPVNPFKGYKK